MFYNVCFQCLEGNFSVALANALCYASTWPKNTVSYYHAINYSHRKLNGKNTVLLYVDGMPGIKGIPERKGTQKIMDNTILLRCNRCRKKLATISITIIPFIAFCNECKVFAFTIPKRLHSGLNDTIIGETCDDKDCWCRKQFE